MTSFLPYSTVNSSTDPCVNPHVNKERMSPAKANYDNIKPRGIPKFCLIAVLHVKKATFLTSVRWS